MSDTFPDDDTDPDAHRITIRVTADGVAVRTTERGGVHLVTAAQAREIADDLLSAVWLVDDVPGRAKLSARPLESCVIVRCAGFASAAECEAFAAELKRVAERAGRYEKPAAPGPFGRKKRKHQLEKVA